MKYRIVYGYLFILLLKLFLTLGLDFAKHGNLKFIIRVGVMFMIMIVIVYFITGMFWSSSIGTNDSISRNGKCLITIKMYGNKLFFKQEIGCR